jgi:hypothetical protein
MISNEAMVKALQLRRIAWATLGTTPLVLKDMAPAKRSEIERASANFREANKTLLQGIIERRGVWSHKGLTLRLNVFGDGIVWSAPIASDANSQKHHRSDVLKAEAANERRFARQKATA